MQTETQLTKEDKQKRIEILGANKSLDEVIEGIIVLSDIAEQNRYVYRNAWKDFLPSIKEGDNNKGKMSYNPVVSMRKCLPQNQEFNGKVRDIPYFIFILNQARESRPHSQDKKDTTETYHCKLCENLIEKGMIISEIDDYWLTPNGYPYHEYASLLIHKDKNRKQEKIKTEDIETWMKASILLNQNIFYNSLKAGASIKEHHHAQVVDPEVLKIDNEIVPSPIFNPAFVGRQSINGREDVFRIKNYPIDALIFLGRDAPHKASYVVHCLQKLGQAFNILVHNNEVYVVGRNPEGETSICIKRKVGGYEISGIGLLGDIEETLGDLKLKKEGAKIFTNMTYEVFRKNIVNSSTELDSLAKKF